MSLRADALAMTSHPDYGLWSFERRILIAYRIERDCVVIEHVLYAGRNLEGQRAPRKLRTE
jgi:hypothetical protein